MSVNADEIVSEINNLYEIMEWYALKPEHGGYKGPFGNRKINKIKEKIKELELSAVNHKE